MVITGNSQVLKSVSADFLRVKILIGVLRIKVLINIRIKIIISV